MKRKRLWLERKKRGWSQQRLGFLSDVASTDISRFETGILIPYPRQAERLAAVLGVPADELIADVDDGSDGAGAA